MPDFTLELIDELAAIRNQGLYRSLRQIDSPQGTRILIEGQELLNFSSNDYLGFADNPLIKEVAAQALLSFGAGSGASRLICGSLAPHHELEETLAGFKGTEAALSFSTGYMAALGTICALVGKNDVIILDRLVHACIVDAARLSGAKVRVFAHNDLNDLEKILLWASKRNIGAAPAGTSRSRRILIVTESVFSMDGDQAPLKPIVELKDRHGAWLLIDEAHATGLFGPLRRGVAEAQGVSDRVEIQLGTLGKALGASGGYICGSRPLIDLLANRARTFIFSTAPVPAAAAAARAGIQLVQSPAGEQRRCLLWDRLSQFLNSENVMLGCTTGDSAIIPIPIGDERLAMAAAFRLRERGIFVPAIRYPTVSRGKARLRVTLTSNHSAADVAQLVRALAETLH